MKESKETKKKKDRIRDEELARDEDDEKVTPVEIVLMIGCAVLLIVIVVMFIKLRGL
ncbi:MAG: hypothetical protein K6F53_00815 [Lachnospiraceae bacterium]|nr:hypothetical protein [Lachnospiraceae bacterium]